MQKCPQKEMMHQKIYILHCINKNDQRTGHIGYYANYKWYIFCFVNINTHIGHYIYDHISPENFIVYEFSF